jgi:P2-related tail formation protein
VAIDPSATSSYLKLLPSIFSEDPSLEEEPFLGRFLLAFEQVLTGLPGGEPDPLTGRALKGLEEMIAGLDVLFDPRRLTKDFLPWVDPQRIEDEFLPWLAGWVALGLRADWTAAQKRDFLSKVVPLYRRRGTKDNLAELLRIYTGLAPEITGTDDTEFQIGVHSTIGVDTRLGGGPAHTFHVTLNMPDADQPTRERQLKVIDALITLQKPAHTTYTREIISKTMQIGKRSTIGVDTLLGTVPVP